MKQFNRNNLILAWIAGYLLISLLSLVICDIMAGRLLENVAVIRLSRQAKSDRAQVQSEVRQLGLKVEQSKVRVDNLASRKLPELGDLKALQAQHRLQLVRMERITASADTETEIISYRTVLSGSVGGVVRFLKELEDRFLVCSDQVMLAPANDDGSQVSLTITVQVGS